MTDIATDQDEETEREALESSIREAMAELSGASPPPTEVDATTEFEASEVRFEDNSWLDYLDRVQGWMRLDDTFDIANEARVVVDDLMTALEFTGEAVERFEGGVVILTDQALERLAGRLDRAVRHKDLFLDALETNTVEAATASWIDAWDDVVEQTVSGPVQAKADTWPILNFADQARRNKLNLSPSYQRGDVWPNKDAQLLIESILRGIPLPSVILLNSNRPDAPTEVVDGKQRLTAIFRFMGCHPEALATVAAIDAEHPEARFQHLWDTSYPAFRRAWKNIIGTPLGTAEEKVRYFPFKLSSTSEGLTGPLEPLRGQYYQAIKNRRIRVGREEIEVRELFEAVPEYKLPVIVYTEATQRQIHEVFHLYNKQGKHLNAEEIRNALYHELELMRALAVGAGDNPHLADAAPSLLPIKHKVERIQALLDDYSFGDGRYRRTKVLSWLGSILFDSCADDGSPRMHSTAKQIDEWLTRVERDRTDPLRQTDTLVRAFEHLHDTIEVHTSLGETWSAYFRNSTGTSKWQELQLVASLLGVALAVAARGPDARALLEEHAEALYQRSLEEWQRPSKTQTKQQWSYIARVSLGVLDTVGIDDSEASAAMERDFQVSSIATLQHASTM